MTETETQYTIYKIFNDEGLAEELIALLQKHNINYRFEKDTSDILFMGTNPINHEFRVAIARQNFSKVDQFLTDEASAEINDIDKDYYLFEFTDEELTEVVSKNDEWSKFDYLLAQKILKERGKEVDLENLATLKKDRLKELAKPEEGKKGWLYAGYIMAFLGGALAIFIGYYMMTIKRTLPNGEKVYVYDQNYRNHGTTIMLIGLATVIIYLVLYFKMMLGNIS